MQHIVQDSHINEIFQTNLTGQYGITIHNDDQFDYLNQFFVDLPKEKTCIPEVNIPEVLQQIDKQDCLQCQRLQLKEIWAPQQNLFEPKIRQIYTQCNSSLKEHLKPSQSSNVTHQILQNKQCIKKSRKVTNVPKFLLKILLSNCLSIFKKYLRQTQQIKYLKNYLNRIKRKQKIPSMQVLSKFLNLHFKSSQITQFQMRKIMAEVIKTSQKSQIFQNQRVKEKKLYTIATKVYRLRCRSTKLTYRATFR